MCIRDFQLKPVKEGKVLTPDEYLEDCLKRSTKQTKPQARFNEIKESIKRYFPKRKCFTLSFPTKEDLHNIESLGEGSLRAQFVKEVKAMREFIYEKKPKFICNVSKKALHGTDLVALLTMYVDAVRKETPIQYKAAYTYASTQRNEHVLKKAIQEFKKEMDKGRSLKSKKKLMEMFMVCHSEAQARILDRSFVYEIKHYQEKATEEMKAYVDELNVVIGEACQKVGAEKLSMMYGDMMKRNRSIYILKHGYEEYEKDMKALENEFYSLMSEYDGDETCMCFYKFKSSKQDEHMKLYRAATEEKDKAEYHIVGAVTKTEMNLQKLRQTRDAQKADIARYMQKLETAGENTENAIEYETIIQAIEGKYKTLEAINEKILTQTDGEDIESEMLETEDYMLNLQI
ncbi:guanylate-binding protein 6-like [Mercenaria mercenaria]|uniref:guanylate-binding protein 6-like n=1 Tax=Mercenaria mercenaria TaxID=6596 RepID=UPI00234F7490|nr:guanylate-binding protein 6-like [Mercenaria mercenaria]